MWDIFLVAGYKTYNQSGLAPADYFHLTELKSGTEPVFNLSVDDVVGSKYQNI